MTRILSVQLFTKIRIIRNRFGNNVQCSVYCIVNGFNALFFAYIFLSFGSGRSERLSEYEIGKGLKSFFFCYAGSCLTLWLEGSVDVLDFSKRLCV